MKNIPVTSQNKRDLSIFQDPFKLLQYNIDSLFDRFTSNINPSSLGLKLDVCDKGKEIIIKADVPGLDEKDISINLTNDLLTIQGEKKQEEKHEKANYYLMERNYGFFSRSLRLPFQASPKDIEADLKKGVLTITIKKQKEEQDKTHKIEVKKA